MLDNLITGFSRFLVQTGIHHPMQALNVRSHTWLSDVVKGLKSQQILVHNGTTQDDTSGSIVSIAFSLVLVYANAAIESFPLATNAHLLSFAIGSLFTTLSQCVDKRAQGLALILFHRLNDAAINNIKGLPMATSDQSRDLLKTKGVNLVTLKHTSLKALPLPVLPHALDKVKEVIVNAPDDGEEAVGSSVTSAPKPFSRSWYMSNIFGVINRTDDTPRRTLLALWYMRELEGGKFARL